MRLETPPIREATLVEICSMTRGNAVPKDATSSTAYDRIEPTTWLIASRTKS